MVTRWCLLAVIALLCCANAVAQKNVLVLVEDEAVKGSHSVFFDALRAQGFTVDVQHHKSAGLRLKAFDTWLYQHLILFAPKAVGFGGFINPSAILDFVDTGHNLLIVGAPDASDTIRTLAADCGVEFDDKGASVFDHFSYQQSAGASVIAASSFAAIPSVLGDGPKAPVLYQGSGQVVAAEADLATVALSAPPTAYSLNPKKALQDPPVAGPGLALVTLVQARNNARIGVTGSLALFSNEFWAAPVTVAATGEEFPASGNAAFVTEVTRWVLQDRGVLVAENLRHSVVGTDEPATQYRITDDVVFEIDIWEVDGGERKPYSGEDVVVSFTMLDPYVRQPLVPTGNGTFSLAFKVPDVYGVFKYTIEYRRRGLSYIDVMQVVPVRPFKHDEFQRFLAPAYPYYASAASTMAAFFLLGVAFLYTKG